MFFDIINSELRVKISPVPKCFLLSFNKYVFSVFLYFLYFSLHFLALFFLPICRMSSLQRIRYFVVSFFCLIFPYLAVPRLLFPGLFHILRIIKDLACTKHLPFPLYTLRDTLPVTPSWDASTHRLVYSNSGLNQNPKEKKKKKKV